MYKASYQAMEVQPMKLTAYVGMALITAATLALTACGGGGGGGGAFFLPGGSPAPAPSAIPVTAKSPVLTNYSTTVFANFSGTTVSNGTNVTFSIAAFKSYSSNGGGAAALTAQTPVASSAAGKQRATVRVKSNVRSDVTVAVASGTLTGSKMVKFIPQPDKAVVHVATKKNISNLSTFSVIVSNSVGTAFTSPAAPAPTPSAAYLPQVTDGVNSFTAAPGFDVYTWLLLKFGINTVSGNSVLDVTFMKDPAATLPGVPLFTVVPDLANPQRLSFTNYTSTAGIPPAGASSYKFLNASDYTLLTDYYLGATLLATQ
jgi:hypothetical protein